MARNRGEKLLRYEGVRLAGIYSQSFSLVKSNRTNAQLQENVLGLSADFNPRTMQCVIRFIPDSNYHLVESSLASVAVRIPI